MRRCPSIKLFKSNAHYLEALRENRELPFIADLIGIELKVSVPDFDYSTEVRDFVYIVKSRTTKNNMVVSLKEFEKIIEQLEKDHRSFNDKKEIIPSISKPYMFLIEDPKSDLNTTKVTAYITSIVFNSHDSITIEYFHDETDFIYNFFKNTPRFNICLLDRNQSICKRYIVIHKCINFKSIPSSPLIHNTEKLIVTCKATIECNITE
jgi:hypothetical protein